MSDELTTGAIRKAIEIASKTSVKPVRNLIGRNAYGKEFYFLYVKHPDQTLAARIRKHASRRPT